MNHKSKTLDTLELLEQLAEPITSKEFAAARKITRHQAAQRLYTCMHEFGVLKRIGVVRNSGSSQASPLYARTPRLVACLAIVRAGKRQSLRMAKPARKAEPAPKISVIETAWREMVAKMDLPAPIDPHASTVSHAVANS